MALCERPEYLPVQDAVMSRWRLPWEAIRRELLVAHLVVLVALTGCSSGRSVEQARLVTGQQLEKLKVLEVYFPVRPDSVVALYRYYEPVKFYSAFAEELRETALLVDSLNAGLPLHLRVDTLAIDHSFEGIGSAGRMGRAMYISSSYFYLFHDINYIRSVVFHEFGHLYYMMLDSAEINEVSSIWIDLRHTESFYLFQDGGYSHNSRFGGHPGDGPNELFASAFNLLHNNAQSLVNRSWLLPESQRTVVDRLSAVVKHAGGRFVSPASDQAP